MKVEMKKWAKRVLSVFMAFAVVVSAFSQAVFPVEASNTGYKEMTFADWGVQEGTVYSLTDPSAISSLDGVAISGTINMNGNSWGDSIISFGGTEAVKNDGFWLCSTGVWAAATVANGAIVNNFTPMDSNPELCQTNGDVNFRITFDKADNANDWTITLYADGTQVYSATYTDLTLGLYISIASGVTVTSEPTGGDNYKEMTFADWGVQEGTVYSLTDPSAISSLDGVAISGTINMNGNSWGDSIISFGGTEAVKNDGFWLCSTGVWAAATVANGAIVNNFTPMDSNPELCQTNGDVNFRITFDKADNANDWTITLYADGTQVYSATYTDLTLGLYISIASGVTVTSEPTGGDNYKEMTFADWGVQEGTVYSLTDPSAISSLDGVAISGTINMNGNSWGDSIISFGGTEAVKNDGFWLCSTGVWAAATVANGAIVNNFTPMDSNPELCQTNGDVNFRITFDKADNANDWTITLYADGTQVYSATYTDLTLGLYISIASGVTVTSEREYVEMKFTDWNVQVADATQTGGWDIYRLADGISLNSLDDVAISGSVDFNGGQFGNGMLTFGATDSALNGGIWLCSDGTQFNYCVQGIGNNTNPWSYISSSSFKADDSMNLRVTFDKATTADDWTVNVYISGVLAGTMTFSDINPGLYLGISPAVTITEITDEEYIEKDFGDWGKKEGVIEGVDVYRLTDSSSLSSLDGIEVGGVVNFNGDANSYFRVGGNEALKFGGFTLITHPETGDLVLWAQGIGTDFAHIVMPKAEWDELISEEFDVKMGFVKTSSNDSSVEDWKVALTIDGHSLGEYEFASVNPGLYITTAGVAISGLGKDEVAENYTELKFSDWGVSEGLSGVHNIFSLTNKNAIESLDGVAISGKINFNGNQWKYITIGGTKDVLHGGFWLIGSDEGGWRMACQGIGTNYGDSISWNPAARLNSEVELRLTFDKAPGGNTWTIRAYGDGTLVGTWQYDNVTPGLYVGVDSLITVEGLDTAAPEFENKYTEIKFSDFSKYEGYLFGSDTYSLVGHDKIKSLDGVAISGKVNYNGLNKRISIGGTDMWKHTGFWLFSADDCLRLSPQGIGDVVIDHWMVFPEQWNELKNKDINLRVTFNKDSKTGAWWVGVYINGEHLGQFNCGVVDPGMAIGVEPGVTIDGLGDIVKNASIDFTLFGYSNEHWRKEMGLE